MVTKEMRGRMTDKLEEMRETVHFIVKSNGLDIPMELIDEILECANDYSEDYTESKNQISKIVEGYLDRQEAE